MNHSFYSFIEYSVELGFQNISKNGHLLLIGGIRIFTYVAKNFLIYAAQRMWLYVSTVTTKGVGLFSFSINIRIFPFF